MKLLPENETFFELLEQLSGHIVTVVEQLDRIAGEYPDIADAVQRIEAEDQTADDLTHSELERLDKAFITPLDREDILHLMTDMYNVVETVADLAQRLLRYKIKTLDRDFAAQARSLRQIADCLNEVILHLRKGHQLSEINDKLQEMHHLTRAAEHELDVSLERLFADDPDPLEVIKRKDVHDRMEQAVEGCENVSRTLQQVILKNS
jgi:uncharacterized protein Yka (UPF0111/DUF47 family)